MAEGSSTQIMESLFDNTEFADLTVRAGDTEFKVHKTILCTASSWFRAACTRGFEESETAVIALPESAIVVKCLLLWLYGLRSRVWDEFSENKFGARIKLAICLHMAGDKYACPVLSEVMTKRVRTDLRHANDLDAREMVGVSVWAYTQTEGRIEDVILFLLTMATAARLRTIIGDVVAWNKITSCASYASGVMHHVVHSPGFPQLSETLLESVWPIK